jgi:hypothetical protein
VGDSLKAKAKKNRAPARYGRAPCPDHHDRVKAKEKVGWIVKFRRELAREIPPLAAANRNWATLGGPRPLLIMSPQKPVEGRWLPWSPGLNTYPSGKEAFRILFWNGKLWSVKYHKAKTYHTREYAEAVAFRLALKDSSLIGELEVEQWVPCSKPKSRRPTAGNAPA